LAYTDIRTIEDLIKEKIVVQLSKTPIPVEEAIQNFRITQDRKNVYIDDFRLRILQDVLKLE